jgi:hypothetical protein
MHRKSLFLSSLFLSAVLVAPMALIANAAPQGVTLRFYDRDHRDYHNWDDREGRYYSDYRVEHPRYAVSFSKTNRRQQREYWKWRHQQRDRD